MPWARRCEEETAGRNVGVYEERPTEAAAKQAILAAAVQAPSASNMALYTVLDLTVQKIKDALAISCDNQPFIATAPMVLIFCADYHRWYHAFCRNVETVRKPAEGDLFLAQADALIAAQNAVVAAESLGIGSCYIGDITENFEYHKQLLGLPDYVVPAAMLCFGYPTEQQKNRTKPKRFAVEELVHENGYDRSKADAMEQMLSSQTGRYGAELQDWIVRFCQRKWNSEFSVEMSRSCAAIIEAWKQGE